jgi:NADH-quinone oxidoreductase subunit M
MITPISYWSETAGFPLLTLLAVIPFCGMLYCFWQSSDTKAVSSAIVTSTLTLSLSLYLLSKFNGEKTGIQFYEQFSFIGFSYSVGVDGLNILFIPLTAITTCLVIVYLSIKEIKISHRYVACILAYEAIILAAFSALNVLQFWVLTLLEVIPIVGLIIEAGLNQKTRFLLIRILQYFGSSLLMTLCGFLLLAFGLIDSEHDLTFDLLTLKQNNAYLHDETLIFILLFYGFAIRMPLFPFHGWLPLLAEQGHLTALTILIVGLKLGVYAIVRFIFPIVPGVAEQWANFVLLLCIVSIFYGAILAFMQNNGYRLLAFAIISHTGMLGLGIFSFNDHGLEGTLLLCLVYGLASAGMLFSFQLIHQYTGTAIIHRLGDQFDRHVRLGVLFLITALSTMIMPGSLGFDAGHMLLEGIIKEHEWIVAVTILVGNVLAAGFLLWAFQRIFLARARRYRHVAHGVHGLWQERVLTFVICGLHIGTGLNSLPLSNLIDQDVEELVRQYPMHGDQQDAESQSLRQKEER